MSGALAALEYFEVTFEVDAVEPAFQAGWSVLVIGAAEVITGVVIVGWVAATPLTPRRPQA